MTTIHERQIKLTKMRKQKNSQARWVMNMIRGFSNF